MQRGSLSYSHRVQTARPGAKAEEAPVPAIVFKQPTPALVFKQPAPAAVYRQPCRSIHGAAVLPLPMVEPGYTPQMDWVAIDAIKR